MGKPVFMSEGAFRQTLLVLECVEGELVDGNVLVTRQHGKIKCIFVDLCLQVFCSIQSKTVHQEVCVLVTYTNKTSVSSCKLFPYCYYYAPGLYLKGFCLFQYIFFFF